nr:hypothetical protein [Acidisarcina polymorpha]
MLVDFLDGTLAAGDLESFQAHLQSPPESASGGDQSCAPCSEMFSHAPQGREWLNFLRVEPPVSSLLVSKILAKTSGTAAARTIDSGNLASEGPSASVLAVPSAPALPFWKRGTMATAGRRVAQPRLLMTAAMAFFSITLTLNMAGVRLTAIRVSDLRPAVLSVNLDKQYHMASARVVRYYDSLRFVYEMEAQYRELRRDADLDNSSPASNPTPPASNGSSQDGNHKNGGKSEAPGAQEPQAILWGEKVEAALRLPAVQTEKSRPGFKPDFREDMGNTLDQIDFKAADQAKEGIA